MTWREQDHPRHPAGSERGGEFRERWAGAVAAAIRSPESDLLELVGRAQRVGSRRLDGGRVATTSHVTLEDVDGTHHELVQKAYATVGAREMAAKEMVVAAIGQAIGARVPVTVLDPRYAGEALYMEFVGGQTALERAGGTPLRQTIISGEVDLVGGDLPDYSLLMPFQTSPSGRRLGLLDLFIANTDRHAGNWLIDDDGEVVGIDHSHVTLGRDVTGLEREWLSGTFTDSYLHEVTEVDEDGVRLYRADLSPIPDLSPAEAARIRRNLQTLFEREEIRRLLVVANGPDLEGVSDEFGAKIIAMRAPDYVGVLLRRWDAIAAMAQGAD